jgi:hypothetical protein
MAKPGYTATLTVTDGAEVQVIAQTYCAQIIISESFTASGWPHGFYVRGSVPGSAQIAQTQGASWRFPGPFQPGDVAGTLELTSAGGASTTFNVAELQA